MQKDLKIGLAVGAVVIIIAIIWLSTRPSLSAKARLSELPGSPNAVPAVEQTPPLTTSPAAAASPNTPALSAGIKAEPQVNTEQTNISQPSAEEHLQKASAQRYHTISKGETLSSISHKYYGTANKWQKIFEANRNIIKNPNRLTPGTKLVIPE